MAVLVKADGTEVVLDSPDRRNASKSEHNPKLLVYSGWYFLQSSGLTLKNIATIANRAVSTISAGIRVYRDHLRDLKSQGRRDLGPALPMLGCRPLVPVPESDEPCQLCGGRIDSDLWVCTQCHAVSEARQNRLDHRTVADSTRDYRTEANRQAAGEPGVQERKAWEEREAAARKAEARGVKARRRSPKRHSERMAK